MSTTHKDIVDALRSRVLDNLTSIKSGLTVADVRWFGGVFEPRGRDFWLAVDYAPAREVQASLASPNLRVEGELQIQFFARRGRVSIADLMSWVDGARDLFALGVTVTAGSDRVRFQEPHAGPFLGDEEEEWYQQPLLCRFYLYTG